MKCSHFKNESSTGWLDLCTVIEAYVVALIEGKESA